MTRNRLRVEDSQVAERAIVPAVTAQSPTGRGSPACRHDVIWGHRIQEMSYRQPCRGAQYLHVIAPTIANIPPRSVRFGDDGMGTGPGSSLPLTESIEMMMFAHGTADGAGGVGRLPFAITSISATMIRSAGSVPQRPSLKAQCSASRDAFHRELEAGAVQAVEYPADGRGTQRPSP